MACDFDELKLTTYALDELEPDEHAAVEGHLRDCEPCRRSVAQIRTLGQSLTAELGKESFPVPALNWRIVESRRLERPLKLRQGSRWGLVAVAAMLLLAITGLMMPSISSSRSRHVAQAPEFRTEIDTGVPGTAPSVTARTDGANSDLSVLTTESLTTAPSLGDAKADLAESAKFEAYEGTDVSPDTRMHFGMSAAGSSAPSNPQPSREVGRPAPVYGGAAMSRDSGTKKAPESTSLGVGPAAPSRAYEPNLGGLGGFDFKSAPSADLGSANAPSNPQPMSQAPMVRRGVFGAGATKRSTEPTDSPAAHAPRASIFSLSEKGSAAAPAAPTSTAASSASVVSAPTQLGRGGAKGFDYRKEPGPPSDAGGDSGVVTDGEAYSPIVDNRFLEVREKPVSTFSIDVDTASYANIRRMLASGSRPPKDAVRIEEMVNYFSYDYAGPKDGKPFSAKIEVAGCPWNEEHRLVQIGLKGREIPDNERPASNLVFLLDVSGSMQPENKLPLVKQALTLLVKKLGENDRVAMVVYAGASGLVLDSTSCMNKDKILSALNYLQSGGSTNGGSGIELAYAKAAENFIRGGTNRVILCTDGDFNVGITSQDALVRLIEEKAKSRVYLSVLGFGMGNLKDSTLEKLADKGNGAYGYIDNFKEAKKFFVDQLAGTLVTIAKDVKIQVEFNPAQVGSYRLIGYENRVLRNRDFNDDKIDAGEIGAGHTVTALYEIVPTSKTAAAPGVDPLKYQPAPAPPPVANDNRELLTLKLRYKDPDQDPSKEGWDRSTLLEFPLIDAGTALADASVDFRFAAAVAAFGMILRDSPHRGDATLDSVMRMAIDSQGTDREGYRAEFLDLVRRANTHSQ